MTVEETLNKVHRENGINMGWHPRHKETVLESMEQYAKQEKIKLLKSMIDAPIHSSTLYEARIHEELYNLLDEPKTKQK